MAIRFPSILQLTLVSAALLAAGAPAGGATTADTPPSPAPARIATAPPRAWVETGSGARWLGYSSYCWDSGHSFVCADYIAPACGGPNPAPRIVLRRGEVVRFVLGFKPRRLSLGFRSGSTAPVALPARQVAPWQADRAGVFSLHATAAKNGDASYVGCIVWRS